jgi:hypothetical protein
MKIKYSIPVLVFLTLVLLSMYSCDSMATGSSQEADLNGSVKELTGRIEKLEKQVAVLQKQVLELTAKSSLKVLTIPGAKPFPGNKIPPGATEHEINGIKYWIIPIKDVN